MSDVKLINQHDDTTCGRACLAMALGIDYDQFDESITGLRYNILENVIHELKKANKPFIVTVGIGFWPNETMIMAVPSLGISGGMHWIYMENGVVYDPQNGVAGKQYYDVNNLPSGCGEIIIINPKYPEAVIEMMQEKIGIITPVQ